MGHSFSKIKANECFIFETGIKHQTNVHLQMRPVSIVVLLQCRTQLIELNSTLARQWRDVWNQVVLLQCYTASLAVARPWFQTSCYRRAELNSWIIRNTLEYIEKFAKLFLYFCVLFLQQPFHSTVIVWIKFGVWNQVVLIMLNNVVLQSSYSRASLARHAQ